MGAAELPDQREQERHDDPHRRGEGRAGTGGALRPLPDHLIEQFRERYRDALTFEGNRAVLLDTDAPLPVEPLRHCIAMALTYHRDKRRGR